MNFKLNLANDIMITYYDVELSQIPPNLINDRSTLVQVIAWYFEVNLW